MAYSDDWFSSLDKAQNRLLGNITDPLMGPARINTPNGPRYLEQNALEKLGGFFTGYSRSAVEQQNYEIDQLRQDPYYSKLLGDSKILNAYRANAVGGTAKERIEGGMAGIRAFGHSVNAADIARNEGYKTKANDPEFKARLEENRLNRELRSEELGLRKKELAQSLDLNTKELGLRDKELKARILSDKLTNRRSYLGNYMSFGASLVGAL